MTTGFRNQESHGRSPQSRDALREEIRAGWRMAALGMTTTSEAVAGGLLGWLADKALGTTQGVVIGAVVGIIVGLWTLVRGSMRLMKDLDARHPPKRPERPAPLPRRDTFEQVDWNEIDRPDIDTDDDWDNDKPERQT